MRTLQFCFAFGLDIHLLQTQTRCCKANYTENTTLHRVRNCLSDSLNIHHPKILQVNPANLSALCVLLDMQRHELILR
jgi:hypothetical protein